jgi:DNA (cytosine-5)-methyltransferase 1
MAAIIRDRVLRSTISAIRPPGCTLRAWYTHDNHCPEETILTTVFGVIDLFAGPGGLGEGFASVTREGVHPFRLACSVEKEVSAHRTLTLRSFLREYRSRHGGSLPHEFLDFHAGRIDEPDWSAVDGDAWKHATSEALRLELGTKDATEALTRAIRNARKRFGKTILIGGPPCQAYSLVGRVRSRAKQGYVPEEDQRHYLFREYIRVLEKLEPAAFVMENVKGMLSSRVESRLVFDMLMEDLSSLGGRSRGMYELRAIKVFEGTATLRKQGEPSDFVVRAEQFGVPQRRHRVIIIGIRSDLAGGVDRARIRLPEGPRTVAQVIGSLPRLRSGISGRGDNDEAWQAAILEEARQVGQLRDLPDGRIKPALKKLRARLKDGGPTQRNSREKADDYGDSKDPLIRWIERGELLELAQHETRGHMRSDLGRYLFASVFARILGESPKADQFPVGLIPEHRNWHSGHFADRFRVQLADRPATTITSHISKDGHYFIHPDPEQCRSLTVREAARLQTFPDDYLFLGNRTEQYVQVGNAVPPYLARQIAELLLQALSGETA